MYKSIKIVFLVIVGVVVLVGTPPYEPYVRNLTYEVIPDEKGNPGGGLKLAWELPLEGPYHGSGCWARSGDPEAWLYIIEVDGIEIDTTHELEYYLYTPGAEVMVNSFDGEESYSGWNSRLDLEPTTVVTLTVYELNGTSYSGIGWDTASGDAAYFSMTDESNQDDIDCYFTDYVYGFDGIIHLASPSELVNDTGNTWLDTAGWRTTLISGALGDFDTITVAPPVDGNYNSAAPVAVNQTYAIKTQDGYYGLIQIEGIDETLGEIYIKATFQPIKGLRWM